MPSEPLVKPLSLFRRRAFFVFLVLFFVLSLPAFIFYATGYRYDFMSDSPSITATGGLYVTVDIPEAMIYVNEAPVTDARTFRNATYIQGLNAGLHRVHVQAPGTHTWVKELNVLPHIVTEVESFNMPLIPHVRVVTPYNTLSGTAVVVVASTTSVPFSFTTTTTSYFATTSRATSTLVANREYARLATLFAEQASTTALRARLFAEVQALKAMNPLATTSATTTALLAFATTTIVSNDVMLYQAGEDVFVKALGTGRDVPVYFCAIPPVEVAQAEAEALALASSTASSTLQEFSQAIEFAPGDLGRECRTDIRIDRKGQPVLDFMFMPSDTNLVLMHLKNGLHVVEVDDRAWQNTQLLYPGENLQVLVDGNRIYASSTEGVVEVFTEIPAQ
ncbi:hypothetical protein K2Q16_00145 [Patescibacteria group bacterium]|nr:hypothetical protein [Patescibacteria group bacterium]